MSGHTPYVQALIPLVVQESRDGATLRQIREQTGLSLHTIGRIVSEHNCGHRLGYRSSREKARRPRLNAQQPTPNTFQKERSE